jgi:hypothetical protein
VVNDCFASSLEFILCWYVFRKFQILGSLPDYQCDVFEVTKWDNPGGHSDRTQAGAPAPSMVPWRNGIVHIQFRAMVSFPLRWDFSSQRSKTNQNKVFKGNRRRGT